MKFQGQTYNTIMVDDDIFRLVHATILLFINDKAITEETYIFASLFCQFCTDIYGHFVNSTQLLHTPTVTFTSYKKEMEK